MTNVLIMNSNIRVQSMNRIFILTKNRSINFTRLNNFLNNRVQRITNSGMINLTNNRRIRQRRNRLLNHATLRRTSLMIIKSIRRPTRQNLNLNGSNVRPLTTITRLRRTLTTTTVFGRFNLNLLRSLFKRRTKTYTRVMGSYRGTALPFLVPHHLGLQQRYTLILSMMW